MRLTYVTICLVGLLVYIVTNTSTGGSAVGYSSHSMERSQIIGRETWLVWAQLAGEVEMNYSVMVNYSEHTTIWGNNATLVDSVVESLSVSDGIPYIQNIVVKDLGLCWGSMRIGPGTIADMVLFTCAIDKPMMRGSQLNQDTWLPFILYHEIAHKKFVYYADNIKEECACDDYAHEMVKELGFNVERIYNCQDVIS